MEIFETSIHTMMVQMMKSLCLYGVSDVGMVRKENEDAFLVRSFQTMDLLIVADGMGGHVGGKIASSLAVETIGHYVEEYGHDQDAEALIMNGMALAHHRIMDRRILEPILKGMGTTCTMAILQRVTDDSQRVRVTMGHIGDSRLYLMNEKGMQQLSTDHSMLQRLLETGALRPEDAESYPYKNVIYKSLGGVDPLMLDPPFTFQLNPGEVLLLCSDGLSTYLSAEEMRRSILGTPSLKLTAAYMVNMAKHRGGSDNITVLLAASGKIPRQRGITLDRVGHQRALGSSKQKKQGKLNPLVRFFKGILK